MAAGDIYFSVPTDAGDCGCECSPTVCPTSADCPEGYVVINYQLPDGTTCGICWVDLTSSAIPPTGDCSCPTFTYEGLEYKIKIEDWYCSEDLAAIGEFGTATRIAAHTRRITSSSVDCSTITTCSGSILKIYRTTFPSDETHPTGYFEVKVERYDIIDCATAHYYLTVYQKEGGAGSFTTTEDTTSDISFSVEYYCDTGDYTIRYADPCGDAPSPCPPGFSEVSPTCPEGDTVGSITAFDGTTCYECVPPPAGPPVPGECPDGYSDTIPDCPDPNTLETDGTCYKCIPPGDPGNPGGFEIDGGVPDEPHDGECPGPDVDTITIVFSGITNCCLTNFVTSGRATAASTSLINGTFTLHRSGGAYVGAGASWSSETFSDSADCSTTPTPSAGSHATNITAVCSSTGKWSITYKDTFDSIYVFSNSTTSPSPISSTISCPGDYFGGGIATIEWL